MSIKKLLDFVEQELLKQGRPSVDDAESCLYRHPDGLKCGVGFLIPDELYSTDIEGRTAAVLNSNIHDYIRAEYSLPTEFNLTQMLDDIQDIHDNLVRSPIFNEDIKETFKKLHEMYSKDPAYN